MVTPYLKPQRNTCPQSSDSRTAVTSSDSRPLADTKAFSGPVISVLNGDAIELLHYQHPHRIHLYGIDCLAKGEDYGKRAKQAALARLDMG